MLLFMYLNDFKLIQLLPLTVYLICHHLIAFLEVFDQFHF